jgi:hypothetical protein
MSFELGAYGDEVARTPDHDRLARDGVRYSNAFSTSSVGARRRRQRRAATNWDDPNGSFRGRAAGPPFFVVVNIFDTHENRACAPFKMGARSRALRSAV